MVDILDNGPDGNELFVYLGTTKGAKGKTFALWISAAELDSQATGADFDAVRRAALWYTAKGEVKASTIGGLYAMKCERSDDGKTSIWFGTKQFKGLSPHPLVPAFQAADALVRDMEYREKNERKASEPVYMRDMERTVEALKGLPRRQALDIVNAIGIELRRRVLEAK